MSLNPELGFETSCTSIDSYYSSVSCAINISKLHTSSLNGSSEIFTSSNILGGYLQLNLSDGATSSSFTIKRNPDSVSGNININLPTNSGKLAIEGVSILRSGNQSKSGILSMTNSDDSTGISLINNFSTSTGILNLDNHSSGIGLHLVNDGIGINSGIGIKLENTGSGSGIFIDNNTIGLGNAIVVANSGLIKSSIDSSGNILANSFRLSQLQVAPASSTSTGLTGEIRITSGYIYVCIATNTWVRSVLSTF